MKTFTVQNSVCPLRSIVSAAIFVLLLGQNQIKAADAGIAKYGDQNEADGLSEGNPIIPGLFADPSMAKFGDTYYLYSTTDGFGWPTGRWVVWKSKDFVHWSFKGHSFPEITGQQNWAPGKPVYRNGRYWLPYTLHGGEGRIAVADKLGGPFHDAFGKAIVRDIDSEIIIDDDGMPYMVWGRPVQSISRLKPDFSGLEGPVTKFDFLAAGATNELGAIFSRLKPQYGKPVCGGKGKHLNPISDQTLPADLIKALKHLPRADAVKDKSAELHFVTPLIGIGPRKASFRAAFLANR